MKIGMLILWLAAVISGAAGWLFHLTALSITAGVASFGFIVMLSVALVRSRPALAEIPGSPDGIKPRLGFALRSGLILLAVLFTFALGMVIGTGAGVLLVCALTGLGLVIAWRRELSGRLLLAAAAVGLFSGLGTFFLGNGDLTWALLTGISLVPVFSAGILLLRRSGLARSLWMDGRVVSGWRSFLWGCLLALPAAILNLLGNMQGSDSWIRHAWQPLYALVPAVAEEIWARLFLVTLCYTLLRPVSGRRPGRALAVAILAGALVHGFAHTVIDPLGLVIGSLLYGLPAGLLFVKKDFEQAVGYHFLIDFLRFGAAFLAGSF
jgi:hypothetical protein